MVRSTKNFGIIALLLILGLVHKSLTKPLPNVEVSSLNKYQQLLKDVDNTENYRELTPKEDLILYTFKEYEKVANFFEKASTELFEACLKDEKVTESDDKDVQEFKESLESYLKTAEKAKDVEDRIELMELFSKTVEPYDLEEKTNPTDHEKFVAVLLDDHGLGQFQNDFGELFIDALEKIFEKFDKYLKTLNEEELKEFKDCANFMDKLKEKETNDDKIKFVFEFIEEEEHKEQKEKDEENGEKQ